MVLPLEGQVVAPCSISELIYCSTMKDWRTHNGIDIGAAVETPVVAAADGKVSQVSEDDLFGVTVVLVHEDGYKTLYANLMDFNFV